MTAAAPICLECRRPLPEERPGAPMRCEPLPDGIPGPILDSQTNHVLPYLDDHGPRFEPVDPARVGEATGNAFLKA